jgi:hypothetical protein
MYESIREKLVSLCKIFWDLENYCPSIQQIQLTDQPIVRPPRILFGRFCKKTLATIFNSQ